MRLLLVGLGLVHSGTVCNEPGFENYRRGGDCVRPPLPVCTDPQAANYLPPGPGMPRRDTNAIPARSRKGQCADLHL